jgi:hypothetical protein
VIRSRTGVYLRKLWGELADSGGNCKSYSGISILGAFGRVFGKVLCGQKKSERDRKVRKKKFTAGHESADAKNPPGDFLPGGFFYSGRGSLSLFLEEFLPAKASQTY